MSTSKLSKKKLTLVGVSLVSLSFMIWSIFQFAGSQNDFRDTSASHDADGVQDSRNLLYGTVTIKSSSPLTHGTVIATTKKSARPIGFAHILSNGNYVISGLPVGEVELSVSPHMKNYTNEGVEDFREAIASEVGVKKNPIQLKQWQNRVGLSPSTYAQEGRRRSNGKQEDKRNAQNKGSKDAKSIQKIAKFDQRIEMQYGPNSANKFNAVIGPGNNILNIELTIQE